MVTETTLHQLPRFSEIREPRVVALMGTGRAGTKVFHSYLDGHEELLMVPAYPLMYLYPHWNTWVEECEGEVLWEYLIDRFCEKHASVLDSRKVAGLSGLDRLGPNQDEHIAVDEALFRDAIRTLVNNEPVARRTFLLSIHYAYGICKDWDISARPVLLYHIHDPHFLPELAQDFPDLKVINMVRDPKPSLNSTVRSNRIVDAEKLNATDVVVYTGRRYRLACYYQFLTMDNLGQFLRREQVVLLRLESLHAQPEHTLRSVCLWLGIHYSECMESSTFDGRIWWGDVTNTTPVQGLDPNAMRDRWKVSEGRIDQFVAEGVLFHLSRYCGYVLSRYTRDSFVYRLLLFFAIFVPSSHEWIILKYYLSPTNHIRFLQAALAEADGKIRLKDYTWNATYRYKWFYKDLHLWCPRIEYRMTGLVAGHRCNSSVGLLLFVGARYVRLWMAIAGFPRQIFLRWLICQRAFFSRLLGRHFLPEMLPGTSTDCGTGS